MTRRGVRGLLLHAVLVAAVAISVFPLFWMLVLASNTTSAIYQVPPKLTFGSHLLSNLRRVFDTIDIIGSLVNTVIVAVCTTALVLFLDSLAAFTFAKFEFPGRRLLFGALLGIFMLPVQLSLIPQFVIMVHLGWVGDLRALIVPAAANAFGIFWMRQYISSAVPDELLDAARIDGCGFFRQYRSIALPIIRPGLAFLGIYTFIVAWNDYVWPLIVLVNPDRLTLQVSLAQLNTTHNTDYSLVITGSLIAVAPLLAVFLLFARYFVNDALKGALRG